VPTAPTLPGDTVGDDARLLDVLQGFVHELRAAGLPVSMTENLDAMRALGYVDLTDRTTFREVLRAALVKQFRHHKSFDIVFDVYFALFSAGIEDDEGAAHGLDELVAPVEGNQKG
jgi:uncharacterized protein with von Willebrand factor type A (vWA) domain